MQLVKSIFFVIFATQHVVSGGILGKSALPTNKSENKVVKSLFTPEEYELDRYAAAIAATEELRKERDNIVLKNTNPLAYWYLKATKGDQYTKWMSSPLISEDTRKVQHSFLLKAGQAISNCNLSITRFNQLSKEVAQNPELSNRINKQADLYRAGADIILDDSRIGPNQEPPNADSSFKMFTPPSLNKLKLFAKSLREIENLRLAQRNKLMETLELDELPEGLCLGPINRVSSMVVRRACEQFPEQASQVVRSNGLDTAEFNRLLIKANRNMFYRFRVLRAVRALSAIDDNSDYLT